MSHEPGTGSSGTDAVQWDCSACETTRLLGATHQHCPICGSAQDPSARYSPSPKKRVAFADHPLVGKDLECLACRAPNSAANNNCGACGCPLVGAREPAREPHSHQALAPEQQSTGRSGIFARAAQSGWFAKAAHSGWFSKAGQSGWFDKATHSGVFTKAGHSGEFAKADHSGAFAKAGQSGWFAKAGHSGTFVDPTQRARRAAFHRELSAASIAERAADQTQKVRVRMIVAGVAVLVGGGLLLLARGGDVEAEVVGHGWSRTIEVEQFSEVQEAASCELRPPGAKLVSQRGGECRYRFNAWHTIHEAQSRGEGLSPEPSWPALRLRRTGEGDCLLCEREGLSYERYEVRLRYDGATATCPFARAAWESIAIGDTFTAPPTQGGELDCGALTPSAP